MLRPKGGQISLNKNAAAVRRQLEGGSIFSGGPVGTSFWWLVILVLAVALVAGEVFFDISALIGGEGVPTAEADWRVVL